MAQAVQLSAGNNLLLSENGLLGMFTTGIRSNADLAANYAGLKFYRNLTEEVRIGNRVMPPMLVRQGPYWRLNDQVQPDSDFFTAFITPHWNEALNPNGYAIVTDARVRAMLRSRCPDLLDWYRDERGRPLSRLEFVAIEQELSTLYGEPYGYQTTARAGSASPPLVSTGLSDTDRVAADSEAGDLSARNARAAEHIGTGCAWQWLPRSVDRADRPPTSLDARNCGGLQGMVGSRKSNACSRKERTPMRRISTERGRCMPQPAGDRSTLLKCLLSHGADHRHEGAVRDDTLTGAIEQAQLASARALLRHGADANTRDLFGRSPLHDACRARQSRVVGLLLDHGADARGGRRQRHNAAAPGGTQRNTVAGGSAVDLRREPEREELERAPHRMTRQRSRAT